MKASLRPSILAAVSVLCICSGIVVAVACLWRSIFHEFNPLIFLFGVAGLNTLTPMAVMGFEDMFTTIDRNGIGQLRIFRGGRFWVRSFLAWDSVKTVSMKKLLFLLEGDGLKVRVSLAFFSNMDEVIEFIEARLPIGDVEETFEVPMTPVRADFVSRWIHVLAIAVIGGWLIGNGEVLNDYVDTRLCGYLLILTSLLWAGRVMESSSVCLDAHGLGQRKVFYRGQFFARHRLAWQDVIKIKPLRKSLRFASRDICIRVDADYFADPYKVANFADAHLPEHLVGSCKIR